MPYLDLIFTDPTITYGIGESLNPGWCIVYRTRVRGLRSRVELASGGDLAKLEGRTFIRVGHIGEEVVGLLHHLPASPGDAERLIEHYDEAYSVEFAMTGEQVVALIEAERLGRGPTGVKAQVQKLQYGWAPDGSETEWDNISERSLPMRSASFYFDNEAKSVGDDDAPSPVPEHPATAAVTTLRGDLKAAMTWIIGLLGVLIVVTWLK